PRPTSRKSVGPISPSRPRRWRRADAASASLWRRLSERQRGAERELVRVLTGAERMRGDAGEGVVEEVGGKPDVLRIPVVHADPDGVEPVAAHQLVDRCGAAVGRGVIEPNVVVLDDELQRVLGLAGLQSGAVDVWRGLHAAESVDEVV